MKRSFVGDVMVRAVHSVWRGLLYQRACVTMCLQELEGCGLMVLW